MTNETDLIGMPTNVALARGFASAGPTAEECACALRQFGAAFRLLEQQDPELNAALEERAKGSILRRAVRRIGFR